MTEGTYKYCVVEYLPDITAGERINIGIELHDMETLVLHKKYTKDVDEIARRYGYSPTLPIVFASLNDPPDVQNKDYLNKKNEKVNNGYERLFWSDVRGGILNGGKIEDSLEHLYGLFVLIDK
jgi:hypothetical protein